MRQLLHLLKTNRFLQFAVGIGAGIFILTLILSPHRSSRPASSPLPSTTSHRPELNNLSAERLRLAVDYRNSIADRFPLYLENFSTTPGITTTINIYYLPDDPPSIVRFEIYGLSYLNPDSNPFTNPNVTAFKESFNKGLTLMREHGIEPNKLIFIYGDVEYVRTAAAAWVDKLNLLP